MPVALRRLLAPVLAVLLGIAAALLVACGDSNGLIPGDEASRLRDALAGVESACANGQLARAQASARRFEQRVAQLRAAGVDRRLVANLRDGAQRLREVVDDQCDTVTETVPTTTETVPPPVDTTPQEPVAPDTTTAPPPTTAPDQGGGTPPAGGGRTTPPSGGDGGGTTPPSDGGRQQPQGPSQQQPGGGAPVQPGDGSSEPNVNRGTPGGVLAPGQGGGE